MAVGVLCDRRAQLTLVHSVFGYVSQHARGDSTCESRGAGPDSRLGLGKRDQEGKYSEAPESALEHPTQAWKHVGCDVRVRNLHLLAMVFSVMAAVIPG